MKKSREEKTKRNGTARMPLILLPVLIVVSTICLTAFLSGKKETRVIETSPRIPHSANYIINSRIYGEKNMSPPEAVHAPDDIVRIEYKTDFTRERDCVTPTE